MISELEKSVLAEVQNLPLSSNTFAEVANKLKIPEDEVISICTDLMHKGIIRRIGPSISHRKIGMDANPMTMLKVPEDKLDDVGSAISAELDVTHCYARSGWDYNLFFMLHAKSRTEADERVKSIVERIGITDYKSMYSVREFKKTSFELPKSIHREGDI